MSLTRMLQALCPRYFLDGTAIDQTLLSTIHPNPSETEDNHQQDQAEPLENDLLYRSFKAAGCDGQAERPERLNYLCISEGSCDNGGFGPAVGLTTCLSTTLITSPTLCCYLMANAEPMMFCLAFPVGIVSGYVAGLFSATVTSGIANCANDYVRSVDREVENNRPRR